MTRNPLLYIHLAAWHPACPAAIPARIPAPCILLGSVAAIPHPTPLPANPNPTPRVGAGGGKQGRGPRFHQCAEFLKLHSRRDYATLDATFLLTHPWNRRSFSFMQALLSILLIIAFAFATEAVIGGIVAVAEKFTKKRKA